MKNLKKLVLICTTNHVPELFSASEPSATYPGAEGGRGGVGIPTPSILIPHPEVEGGKGEEWNSNSEHSIPLPGV